MSALFRSLLGLAVLGAAGCGVAAPAGPARGLAGGGLAVSGKSPAAGIDELFAPMTSGTSPGAAVVVLDRGKVVHQKGYGLAELASKRPVKGDTVFDLGAVSMAFTAMAVMRLAERGALRFDDPLSKHLPRFGGAARGVTLRHLLNHTAGLPDWRALYAQKVASGAWPQGFEPTVEDLVDLLAEHQTPEFEPGSAFAMSGSGYVLLAQVVERASGMRFGEFMQRQVCKPLGLTRTRVHDGSGQADPKRATSYVFRDGSYRPLDARPFQKVHGDAGVSTTAADMGRFSRAWTPGALVSAATLKQAMTPPVLSGGGQSHYGFGMLVKASEAGDDMLMHAGQTAGFRAAILTLPGRGFTAVVLSNSKETAALALADEIMKQVVR